MQEVKAIARDLMEFLDASPVNFYAARTLAGRLDQAGYTRLDPAEAWHIKPGGKYYMVKNDSAVFAVNVADAAPSAGFRIISAHSDSPTFRIKPHPEMVSDGGVVKLNVEVYGGPIMYTWFDRPLSIAGRVVLKGEDALHPRVELVRFERPLLTIPHLAIHFNRAVNEGNRLSAQKDMLPVIGIIKDRAEADGMLLRMVAEAVQCRPEDILDFDLSLYDTTPACLVGMNDEFVTSGRLDDLSMVHAALMALVESDAPCAQTRVMAIFDNEETGSGTKQGAASPVLANMLRRVVESLGGNAEDFDRAIANSFMISADNAHAFHPNYAEKYDPTNHPVPGGGPVIKINARCKYMTDAESAGVFRAICDKAGVPCQTFVNHSDVPGGSTLGNILTAQMDLRGVDMGNALWAMHSVRETASTVDQAYTVKAFKTFFE
ncbi:M18 family aminopeptidase [uncultured Duncaniella sp.]|uniref:M18 family aminopeptidase n=1 Tax=uncultured Duncaniella sp. TaxID=2768039 RepID=UPI00267449EA|nr:M18 family aminopeptidase [uncultured Duncaniella sp.]MCI9172965.1 M18 family aminopeptidase [Muribaculaceae bacterium]